MHWHNIALHVVVWGHDGPFAVFYNNFNINNNNIKLSPEGEVNSGGSTELVGEGIYNLICNHKVF